MTDKVRIEERGPGTKESFSVTFHAPKTSDNMRYEHSIQLATALASRYVNIYVSSKSSTGKYDTTVCACVDKSTMIALRDKLNEVYPVETPAPAKKAPPKGAQAYKGNGKHEWEPAGDKTYRLRVPGGWLYGTRGSYAGDRIHYITFVPVPEVVGYAV